MTDYLADHLREHDRKAWNSTELDLAAAISVVCIMRCRPPTRVDFEAWERLRLSGRAPHGN